MLYETVNEAPTAIESIDQEDTLTLTFPISCLSFCLHQGNILIGFVHETDESGR